jgi:hypothetical protein
MKFAVLDPRPISAAAEANDRIFGFGPVIGIEVTVPALASRCWYNIDPQHTGGNKDIAAIEAAMVVDIREDEYEEFTLVTVRPDLDAVGSMAILNIRAKGESLESATDRIALVASADKFARGGWPGPKALPSANNPWDESSASAESSRPLAAIAAAVADFKVPIGNRVAMMERWLLTGEEPASYRAQVERERNDMIAALESGAIKINRIVGEKVAVIVSEHRAATSIGYSCAPVVVALNPAFRQGPGEPYRKFTVCAFEAKYADIKSALAELAALEPGWGGSPTIGGSPQGVSSKLTIDEVVEVVSRHLK